MIFDSDENDNKSENTAKITINRRHQAAAHNTDVVGKYEIDLLLTPRFIISARLKGNDRSELSQIEPLPPCRSIPFKTTPTLSALIGYRRSLHILFSEFYTSAVSALLSLLFFMCRPLSGPVFGPSSTLALSDNT
ncbi:hypothetical protein JTB14_018968 [Gonioctena quinquepunctata]|nr:hypothetical protein JTB14_018968 [Gonioctena quinquepunctata]